MKKIITFLALFLTVGIANAQQKEEKKYYSNGTLRVHGYYVIAEDGYYMKDGKWQEYYESGKLKSVEFYNNGLKEGEQKEYYENGNLESSEFYSKGKSNGERKRYYENGVLKNSESFKDNISQNNRKDYYKNGKDVVAIKKALTQKIKTTNTEANFVKVNFPAERQTIQLFTKPLEVDGCYFSGMRFTVPTDGYLYWNFMNDIGNTQINTFYIVSKDPKNNDLEVEYFTRMAFGFGKYNGKNSQWIVQKTAEKLKANTEYIIYFKSTESKPVPESLTFELKLSPSNSEKVGTFFKDSFDNVRSDY